MTDPLILCASCSQVLPWLEKFKTKGPVLPRGREAIIIRVHRCPYTIPEDKQ